MSATCPHGIVRRTDGVSECWYCLHGVDPAFETYPRELSCLGDPPCWSSTCTACATFNEGLNAGGDVDLL